MNAEPFEALLEKLNQGDLCATEQILTAYEPYVRMVVRRSLPRRLRAKFDSLDVVQSVWVHFLHGLRASRWQFMDAARLRAFLVRVARRRLTSRVRHYSTALQLEQPGETDLDVVAAPAQPRPSEVAQANELWEKMLALCPPEHHALLRLRCTGMPLVEVAARTGMHEGSVRRILRRLASQLALQRAPLEVSCSAAS
ncbi:MAG TPA: sigma-70 family RNA polymerase sigma factor [Gemmataceae bacterium]|nr:sigma-70 family RNA polymerase sigma factor [Gemmataceae bacterium]